MENIGKHLPSVTALQSSMPSLMKPSAKQVDLARTTAKKILSAYPDFGKAPPEYIINFADALAYLSPDDIAVLVHPTEGLATRCQYLPTIADIHALLKERRARFDKVRATLPRNVLPPDPLPADTDFERRRAHVLELLGYNPQAKAIPVKRTLVPPTQADLDGLKSKLPPPAPATRELWAEIERQDAKHRDVA